MLVYCVRFVLIN